MLERKIEDVAYQLQQNKKNGSGAIVLIGAGCSVSAGIPLAGEIVKELREKYKDNPRVQALSADATYRQLMECFLPSERKEIFKKYVDEASINVSHIYLAQLLIEGYVDYILTVNFDNLAQKALALYNNFPPIYDITTYKDFTTTALDTKAIIYLHGQYNSLWQLNTQAEMNKIIENGIANHIFTKIADNHLFIIIGYSGDDFIFDALIKERRFSNGLYWVSYKDHDPSDRVKEELLNQNNTESYLVKGYDADSFFLKLSGKLDIGNPEIFDKPFSFLTRIQNNIKDIDDTDDYKLVKDRFEGSKKVVLDAINKYEKGGTKKKQMSDKEIEETQLQRELINILANENFSDLLNLESKVFQKDFKSLYPTISDIYNNWGISLSGLAKIKTGEEAESLLKQSIEKYIKAVEIKPNFPEAYNNWGNRLSDLAKIKTGEEAESLLKQSIEKYSKAIEIKLNFPDAYNNWGISLSDLAKIKTGEEAESLLKQSIEKYIKAVEIKPNFPEAYNNWGNRLSGLAKIKKGEEAESLLKQSIEKYIKAIEIKSNFPEAYNNWGISLSDLAKIKTGEEAESLLKQSIEKYSKAIEIKPDFYEAYNSWGIRLSELSKLKKGEEAELLLKQSIEKFNKATEIKPDFYETYTNIGISLLDLADLKTDEEAESLLKQAIEKFKKTIEIKPSYHKAFNSWGTSLSDLAKTKTGEEAESLLKQSIEKYNKAIEIESDFHEAYNNWGNSLSVLAKFKKGEEAESIMKQALEKLNYAVELGGSSYNLACFYALNKKEAKAFELLEKSLNEKEITFNFVENDDDWNELKDSSEYKRLKNRFSL